MKLLRKLKIQFGFWSWLFNTFGEDNIVARSVIVYVPENIEIGNHCIVNEGVLLNARAPITIGNYVHISPYCILNTGGLDYRKTMDKRHHLKKPIKIEDGVWIGSGAIINPGVSIGKNSVIGAGAVVTSDIPADSVAFGVPAKVVKSIYD